MLFIFSKGAFIHVIVLIVVAVPKKKNNVVSCSLYCLLRPTTFLYNNLEVVLKKATPIPDKKIK